MKSYGGGGGGGGRMKLERKTVEKNRRLLMKSLCFKLSSLIPHDQKIVKPTKDSTLQDHLDQAASYIMKLRERVDRLNQWKNESRMSQAGENQGINGENGTMANYSILPVIDVRHVDGNLEVLLICSLNRRFMFHEVISILQEEGVEIINANFSVVGDKIFQTIHCQPINSKFGMNTSSILETLKELLVH